MGRTARAAGLAGHFVGAASRYWLGVFPRVCREVGGWRARAATIPDPELRRPALENLRDERMNLDGAAAFAAFAPAVRRAQVARAQVAFQVAYDYLDTLAEEHVDDATRNGDRLHRALLAALDPALGPIDYYAHHPRREDAGYLTTIVEASRAALGTLPSFASVAASARRAATRMVRYQSLNLCDTGCGHAALERWAHTRPPLDGDLRWWEIAAGAGSSLTVFVLIAAAAERDVQTEDVLAVERAYFPWIGSLHILLDSLIDRRDDLAAGQRCLLDYYASPQDATAGLARLAGESLCRAMALPNGHRHMLVIAGMTSHYLSSREASQPEALAAARAVLGALGGLSAPAMMVMGARRALGKA